MKHSVRFVAACAVLAALTHARRAPAQDADAKAAAQVLFEQGRALIEQGHVAEACPKFAESLRLDRGIGTMLWLADCYERNGQTASAWASFKEATAAAALAHDSREKVARDRVSKLEPRLTTMAILVAPESAVRGLEVRRDGVVLGSAEFGIGVPVDPGIHAIEASAPDRKTWTSSIELQAKPGLVSITIPLLEPAATSPAPTRETWNPAAAGVESTAGSSGGRPWTAQRIGGAALAGAGVIALGLGAFFAIDAKSTYDGSNADGHCTNNHCDSQGLQDRSSAYSLATVSTVLVVSGLAGVGGGAVLYLTAPKERSPPAGLALFTTVLPGGLGLSLESRW